MNELVELVPLPVSALLLPLTRGPPAAVPDFVAAFDLPADLILAFSETVCGLLSSFYFGGVWPFEFPGLFPRSSGAVCWGPVASSSSII